ncbi:MULTISPECIES: malonate decarboxylase holo-ACP synthase [Erwinia]|jgi:phosphoribosyl-dephospho-CoA transferase|uniref:Malonate decarboxylase holo-ACP synthase n=2 Tax=Erwinia TaxID=551 RepID=A0ABV4EBF3_9GAMM
MDVRPHDLLWLSDREALQGDLPEWVAYWQPALPLVVRRDRDAQGRIPVGVRGPARHQRAAGWVDAAAVVRVLSPEALIDRLPHTPFYTLPPVQAALRLAQADWPWAWGVTGSLGYALATGEAVMHAGSDLDLLIRAPEPPAASALQRWQSLCASLPCRADTQLETRLGGFALAEWLRDGKVLLKTDGGPFLTAAPWETPR